jgi:hypothetical protein
MIATTVHSGLFEALDEVWQLCPDMRFGQLMVLLGNLAEDDSDRNLYDVEEDELLAAINRLKGDLLRREAG